ncbi:nucleotidyltransferase family protein [Sulfitobacter sp. F26204]|uniref:nucleotidyltransferase family protein n=1 Tax=Sulfitobacter sp. F26204 TaxID=2996014 RepID=UPI00225DD4AF|nr:nucleotidyltransferase family protein [Sulfitobacter sp. F26204]MCX7559947.1 nucleotidyltransferase family protein [Sulfitobacter sp. F26204]
MTKHSLPIIILAAGASSRMRGRDKLLEDIDGMPLLRRQALKAKAVTLGPVLVTLPAVPHARYDVIDDLALQPVPVQDAAEGMGASLRSAFAALPAQTTCAMLLLGDLPDVTAEDLEKIADAVDLGNDTLVWRGATLQGAPGHPIVFHHSLFPAFANLCGDRGGQDILRHAEGRIALIPLEGDRARRDLDTPEDWKAWRRDRHKNKR